MKAIAVHPGKADSMHLADVPAPSLDDVSGGRGVLVQVLRVGVDATDQEINDAEYGAAPEGDDYLVIGHEGLGRVIDVGPNVPPSLRPGTLVVATVRRPGGSKYDAVGLQDMTTDDTYYERGINLLHGYLTERYVEDADYVVPLPDSLSEVGVLLEPLSIAEKAIHQAQEIQRRLKLWQLERAAVLGAGSIGLLATLALRLRGADVVCYSRGEPPSLNSRLVEALGATYVNSERVDFGAVADEHGPFDLILEATGFSPLVWEAAEAPRQERRARAGERDRRRAHCRDPVRPHQPGLRARQQGDGGLGQLVASRLRARRPGLGARRGALPGLARTDADDADRRARALAGDAAGAHRGR